MFEAFVAPIIKNVLGDYIQDLENTKLNYSLWKGNIILHDLRIRRDALRRLYLPLDVTEGKVNYFNMEIPWNDLKNKPVKIKIDGIRIIADAASTILSEGELEQEFVRKLEALSTAELLLERRLKKTENGDNSHFLQVLFAKMVDNVQFEVSNISIRYTDALSDEEHPYVLDLSLRELSAVSTDENYVPKFITEQLGCICKLIKMDRLEAAWGPRCAKRGSDSMPHLIEDNRIIGPISATAKIMVAKPNGSAEPVNKVLLEFNDVELCIDELQYLSVISHLETLRMRYRREMVNNTVFSKYYETKCIVDSILNSDPLKVAPQVKIPYYGLNLPVILWCSGTIFLFTHGKRSANCALSDIKRKTEDRKLKNIIKRLKNQEEYMKLYLMHRQGVATEESSKAMNNLERSLPYESIVLYRSMVISFMERDAPKSARKDQQAGWSIRGAISSLWWGYGSEDQNQPQLPEDDTMEALFDTVGYDPNAEDAAQYTIRGAMLEVEFKLKTLIVDLRHLSEEDTSLRKNFATLRIENLNTCIYSSSGGISGSFVIGNVVLKNKQKSGTIFPILIGSNSEKASQLERNENPFFRIMFRDTVVDGTKKSSVSLEVLPLNIVIDIKTIQGFTDFFVAHLGNTDTLAIKNDAKDKIMGLTHNTKVAIMSALKDRKMIDLKLDFYAPVLIIPEDIDNPKLSGIVIDLGRFILETDTVKNAQAITRLNEGIHVNNPKSSSATESKKSTQESPPDDAKRLDEALINAIYEDFKCTISDVDVAIVELGQLLNTSGDIKLSELRKGDLCTYQPAIKCSTINVSMGWRIIDSITYLPKIEICVEIPSLDFQISDYHLGRAYSVVSITSELLNINKTPITTEKKCVRRSSTIRELISDTSLPTMDSTLEVDGDLFYEASENPHDSGTGVRTIFSGSAPEYPKIISNVSIHIDSISANIIQSSMSSDGEKMEFRDIFHAKLKNFSISSRDFDNIFEAVLGINDVYLLDLESTNVISGNRGSDQERQVIEITHKQAKSGFDVGTPHIDSSLDVFMGNFSINISDGNIIRMRSFFNSLTGCIKNDSAEVMPNNNSTETNSAMSSPWSKINFRMKHVYISVTYLDEQIATFILGSFLISAILLDDSFKAECVVGSITISNDNPKRSLESVDVCKNLFETIGSEVARFSIVGKNSDGSSDMNNRILSIKLSMRSASIIYEKDAFSSLYAFYENCISTNYLHDTAKQVAINSAHRMKADSSELRLEASIRSIAVVIPSLSQKHSYGVVALMDNVKFSNKFITDTSNLRFNHITANVGNSSISLSHFESIDLRASLIDVIALSPFNVDIDIPVDSSSSHVNVILAISHIKLKPDPVCMEQLMNIYDTVIRTSNGTSSESHAGTTECTNLQNIYSDARGELPRDSASSYLPLVKNDYDINLSCDEVCLTLSVSPENHDTLHFTSLQVIFTRLESQLVQCGNNVSITADIGGIELRNEISVNKPLWSNILVSNCDTHSSIEVKYEYNGGDESQTRVDIISPKVFIDPESVHTLVSLLKSNCNFVKFNDMLWKNEQAKHPSHKIDNHIIFNLEHLSAYVVQDARQTNVDMLFLEIDNFSVDYTKEFNISIRDAFISTGFGGLDGQNVLLHFKNECVAINSLSVVSENSLDFTTANSTISKVAACFSHNDLLFFSDVFKRFRLSKSEGDEEGAPIKEDSEFLIPKTEINNVCRKYSCHINDFIITFIGDAAEPNIQKYLVDISDARLSVEICNDISANIDAELSAYFFNLHNFSWEPVMEKCAWTIDSCYTSGEEDISNKKVSVVLETRSVDIDISHVFIKNILETLDKIRESTELTKLAKRSSAAHYALYNHTGIDMMIFGKGLIPEESESPNSSGSSRKLGISPGSDIRMLEVAPNSHIKFSLPIWRPDSGEHKPAADSLSIYFEGLPVETLRGVSLDATRPMVYTLKPAIDNVRHKVLCNARIEGNTKHFDFFSGMSIKNAAKFEINIYVFITKPPISLPQIRDMEKLLRPGGTFNVPIIISYYGSFYFQPLIPNTSNQRTLMFKNWKELSSNTSVVEICSISDADNSRATYFSLTIVKKKMEGSVYAYPFMDILIRPPFTIENLLPYDIIYELFDDRHHRLVGGSVTAGSGDDIYSISSRKPIRIFVSVLAPVSLRSKEGIVIKIAAENGDIKKIPVYDTNDNALYLFVHCVDGSIKIYCPYVILNKTGLPLQYRTVHITSKPEFLAGQVLYPQSSATEYKYSDPFLYSSKNFEEIKSKLELRIPGSEWGGTIGVEIVGTPNIISLPIGNSDKTTKLSVWVSGNASKCSQTKFIHIEPYVYLKNTCGRTLILAHGTGKATITIKDSETLPLLQFYGNEKNHYLLSVNFECGGYCFSSFLSVINLGPVHLKIPRSDKSGFEILIVEVSLVGFSIHVVFASVEEKCPYLFENTTNINFYVNQDGCKSIYKIPSNGKLPFSWDEPTSSSKLIVISTGIKVLMKTDLFKMGNLGIFKLNTSPNTSKEIAVVSEDRKSYISVTIAEKRKAFSTLLSPKDSHANTGSQELAPYTSPQCTQTTSGTLFNLMLLVSRIGISVINKSVREIIYIYGEDLYIGYTIGPKGKYYEFGLGWLQIDDQSSVVPDQILLYPTSTIKDESGKRARFLSMSASGCADLMYGVNYFKDVNFLMQEISITLDEALLIDFMEFSELFSSQEDGEISTFVLSADYQGGTKHKSQGLSIYFEEFLIQPMKLNLSLVRVREIEDPSYSRDTLTRYAFGNIHDAIVIFKAIELKNTRIKSMREFSELIGAHYKKQLMSQMYRIVGFADIFGSPVGLFNNISSGMSDFFYEPLHGFELARPHYIGAHVARGTASLVKKTVFGLTDTITKISSSIGEGLTAMTLDDSYKKKRHATRVRNRPKHAFHGVTRGAKALATSVASGVKDIVSKPLKGAQSGGFEGFINGIGIGLVGVVTKPVVGVVDMATNFGEGIRNTTTLFDCEIKRKRLTRAIGEDKVLRPYNEFEAYGHYALSSIDYGTKDKAIYCYHASSVSGKIIIVTNISVIEAKDHTFTEVTRVPFIDVERISLVGTTILISLLGRKSNFSTKLTDLSSAKSVHEKASNALTRYRDSVLDIDF